MFDPIKQHSQLLKIFMKGVIILRDTNDSLALVDFRKRQHP